ncbi:Peroxisome proliferator-activated receptor gamma [Bagarius yarrelli]|uniref:Peroxisome proliferator-activated receptor gamma n=1 Tax=Bagarius yarrelli TaxID=175774 RepID=A0A556VX51_BAGYA|nr:Peroxisome proliferator-activated receptor gamma [Bagarius yarrelli]
MSSESSAEPVEARTNPVRSTNTRGYTVLRSFSKSERKIKRVIEFCPLKRLHSVRWCLRAFSAEPCQLEPGAIASEQRKRYSPRRRANRNARSVQCHVAEKNREETGVFWRMNEELKHSFPTSFGFFGEHTLRERGKMITEFHTHTHQLEPGSERQREICRNLHESYIKHFPMTRSKSRAILSGKDPQNTVFVIYDMKSLMVGEEILRQKQSCVSGPVPCAELELSVFRRVTYGSAECVRRLTLFAKSIPGFMELELSDQITMLKYSALEVNIIRLSHLSNQDGVLLGDSCVFMTREFLKSLRKPFCDMMEIKFDFLTKFRALELEDCDLALFITALILCEDRPGLLNPKAIEVLQDDVLQALELQLKILHPDAPHLFAKLLHKMTDLRPLVAQHVRNIHLLKQNELDLCLHPLLLEIMQDLY